MGGRHDTRTERMKKDEAMKLDGTRRSRTRKNDERKMEDWKK